jgi:osmotically inducible protein OsmC
MNAAAKNILVRGGRAQWLGTLARGEGRLSTDSGALHDHRYAFATRFAQEAGTNPEELIAAADAGCYSMALAYLLARAGARPRQIKTTASLTLQMSTEGPEVSGIHLRVEATVDGVDTGAFERIALSAKETCLVSRLLKSAVSLEARLLA